MIGENEVGLLRAAFRNLNREQHHVATIPPRWAEVFTPDGHEGALDPHRTIVVGDRGTGKSFWSSVLVDDTLKLRVAETYPRLGLLNVQCKLGFSSDLVSDRHPSPPEIADVIAKGMHPEHLWRAVLIRMAPLSLNGAPEPSATWLQWTQWVASDAALRNDVLRDIDRKLADQQKTYVLVFDGLDVIAKEWSLIRAQIEAILQLALVVRSLRRIRIKMFMRPDMADDRRMWMVGDASKLRHDEVQLRWTRRDLYGMLWTHIANPEVSHDDAAADAFRRIVYNLLNAPFKNNDELWSLPHILRESEDSQRLLFHVLAGKFMGAGNKTGDTYLWVPNHLADAAGNAAPRSFVLAMRKAAEATNSSAKVLDRSGIEEGVREASKIRLVELGEDYRWMHDVLGSLDGLTVPISRSDLSSRWRERGILGKLNEAAQRTDDLRFIPPGEVLEASSEGEAYQKLIEALKTLRIILEIPDGRINMPDLFRVEANVKRKGGMKPRQ